MYLSYQVNGVEGMKRITSAGFLRKGLRFVFVGLTCFMLVNAQTSVTLLPESFVEYEAKDEREVVTGRTSIKQLELLFDAGNVSASSLRVVLDASGFDSGNFARDTNARLTVFESKKYPELAFLLDDVSPEANFLAEGETLEVVLQGELSMHGVTKNIEAVASLTLQEGVLLAEGGFEVLLSDFEMSRPSFLVWTIEDTVIIRFSIKGSL